MFLANYGDGLTDVPLAALIEDFKRSGKVAAFLGVPAELQLPPRRGRRRTAWSRGIERRRRGGPLDQRRLLRLPSRDLRLHRAGRGAGRGAVPAADRRAAAAGAPSRGLLGADGHVQGREQLEDVSPRARRRGRSGSAGAARGVIASAAGSRRPPGAAVSRAGAWARTPTTSRSAAAGRCALLERARGTLPVGRPPRRRQRAAEAEARGGEFLRRVRGDGELGGFRDGYLPYAGGRVKDCFEASRRVRARSRPHPPSRRPAPGPPARRRARVADVPRPPDPRVRDPEVRRRPRLAQHVRAARRRPRRRARCAARSEASPASRAGWFNAETFWPAPAARDRGPRRSGYAEAFHGRKVDPVRETRCASSSPATSATSAPCSCRCSTTPATRSSASTPTSTRGARSATRRGCPPSDKDIRDVERRPRGLRRGLHLAALSNDPLGDLRPRRDLRRSTIGRRCAWRSWPRRPACRASSSRLRAATTAPRATSLLDESADFNPVTPTAGPRSGPSATSPAGRRELQPGLPAQRHRLRRVASPALRPRRQQPGGHAHHRQGPDQERRHALAPAGPHRGHLARLPGGPGRSARARPRPGFNVGATDENYRIREVAEIVGTSCPAARSSIADGGTPRQARLPRRLRPHRPRAAGLPAPVDRAPRRRAALRRLQGPRPDQEEFLSSRYLRILTVLDLKERGRLDEQLRWR